MPTSPTIMKLLRKSCCGCSVKTGALVICYIALVQAVVPILNILSNTAPEMTNDKKLANEYKRDLTWLSVVTIVVVAHALYGIYKKKAGYMVPFLIYKLILLFIFTLILGFAPAMTDEIKRHFDHIREENVLPCVIVTSLFLIAIEAYFLLILFSHYQNVRHEAMEAANPPTVGFTAVAVPEAPETLAPYSPYNNEIPKKQAPPPYAV